jgi:hypothetical protein
MDYEIFPKILTKIQQSIPPMPTDMELLPSGNRFRISPDNFPQKNLQIIIF